MYTQRLILVLSIAITLAHAQTTLNFGDIATCDCPGASTNIEYTLTLPPWPSTPAQAFVIVLRSPGSGIVQYPVQASVGGNSWEVLADTQYQEVGELWVPLHSAGTIVNIVVSCTSAATYTLEPVIPSAINNSTNISNFNFTSVTDEATPHAHWWAVPVDSSTAGYLWAELCQVPSASDYLFYTRVVFPDVNVSGITCTDQGTSTYVLSSSSNFRESSQVGLTVSWLNHLISVPVFYVSLYGSANLYPTPVSFNVYQANSNAPIQYRGTAEGLFTGHAIQVENDLFISGISGRYYPTDTDAMKLYFIDDSNKVLDTSLLSSACYLRTQAQSALFAGHLKNSSQESDVGATIVKAPNFFKGRTSSFSSTFALTYGDYIVLPAIHDATKLNGYKNNGTLLLGVVIGLAIFSGLLLVVVAVLGLKLQRGAGYTSIH